MADEGNVILKKKKKSEADVSLDEPTAKKTCQSLLIGDNKTVSISQLWKLTHSVAIYTPSEVKPASKVLALDLDGTLIQTASGRVFPKDYNDWIIMTPTVQKVLQQFALKNFKLVIMSNQQGLEKHPEKIEPFQRKMENIVRKLDLPIQVFVSIKSDMNRKPRTGMWQCLEKENCGIPIVKEESIYCGDAAGREALLKIKKDHSHCDRLFARNVGVPFMTPEELWNRQPCGRKLYPLSFDPKELLKSSFDLPSFTKSESPEILVMVGLPASGKSSFCKENLLELGYEIVSRDASGVMAKCLKMTEDVLSMGRSVVIDNTNVDIESRSRFLAIAKRLKIPCRALVMNATLSNCRHNEVFRQLTGTSHEKINDMIFNMMNSRYRAPTIEEGFTEIISVPFIPNPPDHYRDLYFQYLLDK